MVEQNNSTFTRAILHALPTAVVALDSSSNVIIANDQAARLLNIDRSQLEGGSIARFVSPSVEFTSTAKKVVFAANSQNIELMVAAKDLIVDDSSIKVLLLKRALAENKNQLLELITQLVTTDSPYKLLCESLVKLGITQHAYVKSSAPDSEEIYFSTTDPKSLKKMPSVSRNIYKDEFSSVDLVIFPDEVRGITKNDISTIDMLISILTLKLSTQENETDASGSETALALALKAADMGMCFFDTSKNECYLSDTLAIWCGINPDTFDGKLDSFIDKFNNDDQSRIRNLFRELDEHKKFKTVVNVNTYEQNMRLELFGRPLHESNKSEWVLIAKPYRDEQEVEAAWQTRISMEESARIDAENELESFEQSLFETLLPTTSDVTINHSRQDAGTWHVARPFGGNSHLYAVGAVSTNDRQEAVVSSVIIANMVDVLASEVESVDEFVDLIRDHARARDIDTSISVVRVTDNKLQAASVGGASVYISGKSFSGEKIIESTTALSLSSHSEASPDTIDVAANGRPWRILSAVIEIINLNEERETPSEPEATTEVESKAIPLPQTPSNVSPFRSGSISPS